MATVSELKAQARVLEQQGQLSKALAIYQHILKHIEGTPSLLRELPLYVKAGDLQLKLDESGVPQSKCTSGRPSTMRRTGLRKA